MCLIIIIIIIIIRHARYGQIHVCICHLRTVGHVIDKSKTNPLENSSGFVLDLSKTCPLVASTHTDLSVSGMS